MRDMDVKLINALTGDTSNRSVKPVEEKEEPVIETKKVETRRTKK